MERRHIRCTQICADCFDFICADQLFLRCLRSIYETLFFTRSLRSILASRPPFLLPNSVVLKYIPITCQFARVAQWIERLPPEQEVTGSNPVAGTFSPRARVRGFFCVKTAENGPTTGRSGQFLYSFHTQTLRAPHGH